MNVLLSQLSDKSSKVVRISICILHKIITVGVLHIYSLCKHNTLYGVLQQYPKCVDKLRYAHLDVLGEAGFLIETRLLSDEKYVIDHRVDVERIVNRWHKVVDSYRSRSPKYDIEGIHVQIC